MSPILKVDPGGSTEAQELDFELDYQAALTTQQRFHLMFESSRLMAEQLLRHGHRSAVEVLKRS